MAFFLIPTVLMAAGWLAHLTFDRHPERRTTGRLVELALLWLLVFGGLWNVFSGVGHLGPDSGALAEQIGYRQSMFQWEVGWADIAVGVLGLGCALPRLRGTWLTAAVVAWAISYWGDAIGHLMQLIAHDNRQPYNVGVLPADLLWPALAIVLLVAYRRTRPAPRPATAPAGTGARGER